jgi:hypothetical protein
MSRRARGVLYALAGALVVVGLALRLAPAAPPTAHARPPEPYQPVAPPSGEEQAATLLSYHQIVTGNLLSPDRAAPESRYVPPELAVEATPEAPVRPAAPAPSAPRLRLFGTAVGPEGSVALIDADPTIPGAEVYRVDDRVQGSRIVEILETAVVLQGPSGRITLTLPSALRRLP